MARSADVSRPFSSGSTPIQIVGTPAATRDLLVDDEVGDRRRRQVGPGHDRGRRRTATAAWARPQALAWNIGHDRQDAVGLADADAVGQHRPERVQERGAVRVHDALGVARGAARVAHATRPGSRRRRGTRSGAASAEQRLVVVDRGWRSASGTSPLPSSISTRCFTVVERRQQREQQRRQRPVDEDHLVLGVVDDVGELLGEQPDVERVQHPPGARRGEVQLEVAGGVPAERGHPAVGGDAEGVEHAAEAAGAVGPLAVGLVLGATPRGRRDPLRRESTARSARTTTPA